MDSRQVVQAGLELNLQPRTKICDPPVSVFWASPELAELDTFKKRIWRQISI